jgi:hypothetical protein
MAFAQHTISRYRARTQMPVAGEIQRRDRHTSEDLIGGTSPRTQEFTGRPVGLLSQEANEIDLHPR